MMNKKIANLVQIAIPTKINLKNLWKKQLN